MVHAHMSVVIAHVAVHKVILMAFGDIALNWMVDEMGMNRCHGMLSPSRTPSGDIAHVTDPEMCIFQRIAVWKATKKGERQFNGNIGCCIRDYINEPLTQSRLLALQKDVERELKQVFPEMDVVVSRVRSDYRNQVTIETTIGNFDLEISSNSEELDRMHTDLQRALSDLRLGVYRQ